MTNNDNKEKISLENFNYESKTHRLTSPFSIRACRLEGVTEKDLYRITLEEYIESHPESMNLPKELQQERYDNYEQNRTKLIESLKEMRNKLIEESEEIKQKEKEVKEIEEAQKEEANDEDNNTAIIKDKNMLTIKSKDNLK